MYCRKYDETLFLTVIDNTLFVIFGNYLQVYQKL